MYLTLFVALLAVLIIGLGMLKYRKRSIAKNITSIVIIVISAVLSCIITRLVAGSLGAPILELLKTSDPEIFEQITTDLPTVAELVPAFVSMIVAPFMFVFVMLIVRGLVSIFGRLMTKGFSAIHESLTKPQLAINLSLAVVGGLLIVSIYTAPLIGFATAGHTVLDSIKTEDTADIAAIDDEFVEPFADSFFTKTVYFCGGKPVFNVLTSYKIESGTKISLSNEVPVLSSAVVSIMDMGFDFAQYGPEEAEKIRGLNDVFAESDLLRVIGAEAFRGLANAWLDGEAFIGIERPEGEAMLDEIIDGVLYIFEDTTVETFPHDLSAVTDTIAVLAETGVLAAVSAPEADIMQVLQTEGALESILMAVYDNDAAHPVLAALINACTGVLSETLGIYESPEAAAESFAEALAELSAKDMSVEEMTEEVKTIRTNYSVEWTDEQCAAIAAQIKSTPYSAPTTHVFGFGIALLANSKVPAPANNTVTDFSAWLNGVIEATPEEIPAPQPKVVTAQDLKLNHSTIKNIDRTKMVKLAQSLPSVISAVTGGGSDDSSAASNPLDLIGVVGPILDVLADVPSSSTEGSEEEASVAENLMVGILQSSVGQELTGMSPDQAKDVIKDVMNSQKEEGSNFTDTTKQVSSLVSLLNKQGEDVEFNEEMINTAKDIIRNMNAASASLLKSMVTDSMLVNLGVPETEAHAIATTLANLVDSIVEYRKSLTEEEYDKEADAICDIINVLTKTSDVDAEKYAGVFNSAAGNGVMGKTADAFVKSILDSKILTKTLVESKAALAESEEISLHDALNETELVDVKAALENAKTQYPNSATAIETLETLFGV